jgi:hypothetical protein
MPLSRNERTALDNLLNKGDIAGASALLAAKVDPNAPKPGDPPPPPPPPKPRTQNEVVLDAFKVISRLLGENPAFMVILNELNEVLAPPATEETAAS